MDLPLCPPYPPMEAQLADELPAGPGWQYEPKWDGFRCLAFRDGEEVELQSKAGQPLARYFPELVEALRGLPARRFVLDSEIAVPVEGALSFDDLLQRIHPAESRVRRLSRERPAILIAFDLLVDGSRRAGAASRLWERPLVERRRALEEFARKSFPGRPDQGRGGMFRLSPAATDLATARRWLRSSGGAQDGVVAKRLDLPYRSGERDGMIKVKRLRTADCVVGGFRRLKGRRDAVGSLLLGLHDREGKLHHVGFTSGFGAEERRGLLRKLEPLRRKPGEAGAGFSGRAPGGPSRWNAGASSAWEAVLPKLVAEVQYDHFTGGRFRHGTRFLRWRPDKAPRQCTLAQVERESRTQIPALAV